MEQIRSCAGPSGALTTALAVAACCGVAGSAIAQPARCDGEWKLVSSSVGRTMAAGAWDPVGQRTIMYGGYDESLAWSPETWAFDGAKWTLLSSGLPRTDQVPLNYLASGTSAAMAFDPVRQKMCLAVMGVTDPTKGTKNWLYELENDRWVPKVNLPWGFLPQGEWFLHLDFDYAAGKPLLTDEYRDGWWYTGSGWMRAWAESTLPNRRAHRSFSDPVAKSVHYLGNLQLSGTGDRAWGTGWSDVATIAPWPLTGATMTSGMTTIYSPVDGGAISVGGDQVLNAPSTPFAHLNLPNKATWLWNGASWVDWQISAPALRGALGVFDTKRQRPFLFGGISLISSAVATGDSSAGVGDVWELESGVWRAVQAPPILSANDTRAPLGASCFVDATTGKLVVPTLHFASGGPSQFIQANRQSEWRDGGWTSREWTFAGTPPIVSNGIGCLPQFVWDTANGRAVMIAAVNPSNRVATFAYDGADWTEIAALTNSWQNAHLVYNPLRGKVTAVGGPGGPPFGVWELHGNSWVQISTKSPNLGFGQGDSICFDEARGKIVVVAQSRATEWDGSAWSGQPAGMNTSWHGAAYNPTLKRTVTLDYSSSTVVAIPQAGHPYSTLKNLWSFDGSKWSEMKTVKAHAADIGMIWQDQSSGRWLSYSGGPRYDIWEFVPIQGDRFSAQPQGRVNYTGRTTTLKVNVQSGMSVPSYQWRCNGAAIVGGALPGGSPVSGANSDTLTVQLQSRGNFVFDCAVTLGECSAYTSDAATVSVTCAGDISGDGSVNDADFLNFVVQYDILDCADPAMPANCLADLNGDGVVDDADFSVFVVAYGAMICP